MPKSPADGSNPTIDRDVRSMERKKRVSEVLGEKSFRNELEDVVVAQKEGNRPMFHSGLKMSSSNSSFGSPEFKGMSNVRQVNDLHGALRDRYGKPERDLRCKLAALYRLTAKFEWDHLIYSHITAKLPNKEEYLINPYGMQYSDVTASSLIKIDIEGNILDPGSTILPVNKAGFKLNSALHKAGRNVVYHTHSHAGTAISAMKCGLLNLCQEALMVRPVSYGTYQGFVPNDEEQKKLVDDFMDNSNVMILVNHGLVSTGKTIEEAFLWMSQLTKACEIQWRVLRHGDIGTVIDDDYVDKHEGTLPVELTENPQGRPYGVGELEFESYMRKMDGEGQNTGYPYKTPSVFKDQLPVYNPIQIPPIVPGMEGPPSDHERTRPNNAQRAAWFKDNTPREQKYSPPGSGGDEPKQTSWTKSVPDSGKKEGPKTFQPFDSVLSSDVSSPKYNRGGDASRSPRMRDIEQELERLQQQYRTKDKPPKEDTGSSSGTHVSDPSSDGKRSDKANVESLSDSHPSDIAVDVVDLGEDLPTVTADDVDMVEDAPTVEVDAIQKVEKYDPTSSRLRRPKSSDDPAKTFDIPTDSDFSEDVLSGVQDDLHEIEQLVVNTDDAFTGMSEDDQATPTDPHKTPTVPAQQIPPEQLRDPKVKTDVYTFEKHDTQTTVDVKVGDTEVEIEGLVTHTQTTSIVEITEIQEDEYEVITVSPGQLTEMQKDELRAQGYVIQESE